MRTITFIFAVLVLATSCKKTETTYWCQTSDVSGTDMNPKTLTMTSKEKDEYVKSNTIEIDGNASTIISGEKHTICDPIK